MDAAKQYFGTSQHQSIHFPLWTAQHFGVLRSIFGDQHRNAADAVMSGRALKVDIKNITQVEAALKEITENKTYFVRTKYLSKLYRARPVSPSRMVSFYVELAIETKGAFHLRSKALLYSWYEIQNLDVIAVVLLILLMLFFSCRTTYKLLCWCCRRKTEDSYKKKVK